LTGQEVGRPLWLTDVQRRTQVEPVDRTIDRQRVSSLEMAQSTERSTARPLPSWRSTGRSTDLPNGQKSNH